MATRPELGVACKRCGAQPGRRCTSPSGREVNFHTVRLHDSSSPTPEEARRRADERRVFEAQYDPRTLVTIAFGFTCGCTQPPSEPIPLKDANTTGVGVGLICDTHDELTVVNRATVRLVADEPTMLRILTAAGVPEFSAQYVAGDQNDTARADRQRHYGRNDPA